MAQTVAGHIDERLAHFRRDMAQIRDTLAHFHGQEVYEDLVRLGEEVTLYREAADQAQQAEQRLYAGIAADVAPYLTPALTRAQRAWQTLRQFVHGQKESYERDQDSLSY